MSIYFLWPKPKFKIQNLFKYLNIKCEEIEDEISNYYKNKGYPVLVSSGRVAIKICLIYLNQNKKNKVKVFNYASKCVTNAVEKVSNVSYENLNYDQVEIIYHHMACIQRHNLPKIFIEDSVDSLVDKNANLFPLNGLFEIWSLEKIYGLIGGGIIWCKDKETQQILKETINKHQKKSNLIWLIRFLSLFSSKIRKIWDKYEVNCFLIPKIFLNQFEPSFLKNNKSAEIIKKIELLKSFLPEWYSVDYKRLPSHIPLILNDSKVKQLKNLGFSTENRHFEIIENHEIKKIKFYPIPIHYQVPIQIIKKTVEIISK